MRSVRATSPLTHQEEQGLLTAAVDGNTAARDRLVEAYQPFIAGIARRFSGRCAVLELLDLAQEGTIGLLLAIEARHKCAEDMPFRGWSFYWIRNAMLQAIYRCERAIRLPLRTIKRLRRLVAMQTQLLGALGREATADELATALDLPEVLVLDLLLLQAERFTSLDVPLADDGDLALVDMLPAPSSDTLAQVSRLHRWLRSVVEALPERERQVITLRYGFDGDETHTTRQIADLLGLSHSLVQDIDRRVRLRVQAAIERQRASALLPALAA